MPKFEIHQNSFSGGQINRNMMGRRDLNKYFHSALMIENLIVKRTGSMARRSGVVYLGAVGSEENVTDCRIIPFCFSRDAGYCIVLTPEGTPKTVMFNVYEGTKNGFNHVGSFTSTYPGAVMHDLRYMQSGDMLFITHPSYAPRMITRSASGVFSLGAVPFVNSSSVAGPVISTGTLVTLTGGGTANNNPSRIIYYMATQVVNGVESAPSAVVSRTGPFPWLEGEYLPVNVTTFNPLASAVRFYRNAGTGWGLIGERQMNDGAGSNRMCDNNIRADMSATLMQFDASLFASAGNYPSVTSLYQQRLVFASSRNGPARIWMSVTGDLFNFGRHAIIQEDDSINMSLPLTRGRKILHVVQHRDLLVFCENAEVVVKPATGNAVTYRTVSAENQSSTGVSERNVPLVCGNAVLFVDAAGASVREFKYDYTLDAMAGRDVSVMNSELFANAFIADWAYQMYPESVVWCVLSDGRLAALTYMPEQDVYAWHTHRVDGFRFTSVCCTDALTDGRTSQMFFAGFHTKETPLSSASPVVLAFKNNDSANRFLDDPYTPPNPVQDPVRTPIVCRFMGVVPETEKGELNTAVKRIVDVKVRAIHGERLRAGSVNDVGDTAGLDALAVEEAPKDAGHSNCSILSAQVRGGHCREPRVVLEDDTDAPLEILSLTTGVEVKGRD